MSQKFTTEWGVASPWGTSSVEDLESAMIIMKNMKSAGHKAEVVYRGVTAWVPQDGMD